MMWGKTKMKRKNKKNKSLRVHKNDVQKKIDFNLKNWKYIIPTFFESQLDVISQFQEGDFREYPDWFIVQNNVFATIMYKIIYVQ